MSRLPKAHRSPYRQSRRGGSSRCLSWITTTMLPQSSTSRASMRCRPHEISPCDCPYPTLQPEGSGRGRPRQCDSGSNRDRGRQRRSGAAVERGPESLKALTAEYEVEAKKLANYNGMMGRARDGRRSKASSRRSGRLGPQSPEGRDLLQLCRPARSGQMLHCDLQGHGKQSILVDHSL